VFGVWCFVFGVLCLVFGVGYLAVWAQRAMALGATLSVREGFRVRAAISLDHRGCNAAPAGKIPADPREFNSFLPNTKH
jgi:hypothetical protein